MRIVLCYPVLERHIRQIQHAAPAAEIVNAGQERVDQELLSADIFCGHAKVPVDWQRVVEGGRLKWIQSSAAGLDHCLVPYVIESPILVTSASGLFARQVAEQALAILLGLIRSMPDFHRAQQAHEFVRLPTDDLQGKTVGIVGLGGNGRQIARVLAAFDVRIVATDRFPINKPDHVEQLWPAAELPRLLEECDVIVLCVPLNDETHGLMNRHMFAHCRSAAILINVARGAVVVERDLVAALQQKQLAAAGLDVTEVEPLPTNSPLWDMPNVIITPHVGAQSSSRVDDMTDFFCQNLQRWQSGQSLANVVNKQLGFPIPAEDDSPDAVK